MRNKILKIWKDPVWSKVIAAGIIAITVWVSGIYSTLFDWFLNVALHLWSNLLLYLFILSVVIILLLFRKLIKTKKSLHPIKVSGYKWFTTLSDDSFYKYLFLLWFPLHRSLQTEKFFYDEKFEHIPEFYDLYKKEIIFNKSVSAIEYVIVIDRDVYDYLEEFYQREKEKFDADTSKFVNTLTNIPFYGLRQGRNY